MTDLLKSAIDRSDPRLRFVPRDKVLEVRGPCLALHDYFWCVCQERGLILYGPSRAPQANTNRDAARRLRDRLYPWAAVEKIDLVLLRDAGR